MKSDKVSAKAPIKLFGKMIWFREAPSYQWTENVQALIRGKNEIVVYCEHGKNVYDAHLFSKDGVNFTSEFVSKRGSRVNIRCKLWENAAGYLLFGNWIEDIDKYEWLVELSESTTL